MRTRVAYLLIGGCLLTTLSGCFISREIAHARRDVERAYPGMRLERQIVVNLGPLSLRTLGWIAGLAADENAEQVRDYLRDVRRLKVGYYRMDNSAAEKWPSVEMRDATAQRLSFERRWEVALRVRNEESHVWVLYREAHGAVRDLCIVTLTGGEFVVVRAGGRLDRLLLRILEDHAAPNASWHSLYQSP